MTKKRFVVFTLFCALALTVAAKEDSRDAPIAWAQRMTPGPAVALRLKRSPGQFLIYDGTLERTQQGASSYTETDAFYVQVLCTDKREERIGGQARQLDMLAIRRTYTERKRSEKLENGKVIPRVLENADSLIDLGPNHEMVGALRCYASDPQNCLAYRTEQLAVLKDGRQLHGRILSQTPEKVVFLTDSDTFELKPVEIASTSLVPTPYVCLDEKPHYLFPPFPSRNVAPGEIWKFKVPVIIPLQQGNPPQILPTQFSVQVVGRLCEVRAGQEALIEYHVSGVFDSRGEEFSARFPPGFHTESRIIHKMTGQGILLVDLEKGRILEKDETLTFVLFAAGTPTRAEGEKNPRAQENQLEVTSHFTMKLVPPGQRLKTGVMVPDYDRLESTARDSQPPPEPATPRNRRR